MSKRLSPYARIVRNAKLGKGVVLSPDEVQTLANDNAILQVGEFDLANPNSSEDEGWEDEPIRPAEDAP